MSKFTQLVSILIKKSLTIAVAESCTGGSLSARLTSQSGASNYFDRGFITYSNQAKIDMLDVKSTTLDKFGAVSEQVVLEMTRGVIKNSNADIGVAITGIAGPLGGSRQKPVGTVCFGFCINGKYSSTSWYFDGDRREIVEQSVMFVTDTLTKQLLSNYA